MKDLFKFPLDIQYFAEEEKKDDNEDTGADDNNQGGGTQEKTFTQAEVDALIAKEKARAKKQTQKQSTKKTDAESIDESATAAQENPYIDKYAQAEIKFAMVQNGVDTKKAARAIRLIDHKGLIDEDGEINAEALNTAIADLLKEWPELAPSKEDDQQGIRKIGSEGKKGKGNEDDLIAQAFGNKQ